MKRKRDINCMKCGKAIRVRTSALADWNCASCSPSGYPTQVAIHTKEQVNESIRQAYARAGFAVKGITE
jgi:ribosomal protein L37AE/L43A